MAETGFAAGGQLLSNTSRTRSVGTFTSARPSSPEGGRESAFDSSLNLEGPGRGSALDNSTTAFQDDPIPSGSALLSTPVLFVLAETRTQEAEAARSFPAPASVDRAIGSYANTAASVRETIISAGAVSKR